MRRRTSQRRASASTKLVVLIERFRRHAGVRCVEVDSALSSSLRAPDADIEALIACLLEGGATSGPAGVGLFADVVGEDRDGQRIHVSICGGRVLSPRDWSRATAMARRMRGLLFQETDEGGTHHVILELALPFGRHDVDIDTLRASLGSEQALQGMVRLLDDTLGRDLDALDALLEAPGGAPLQAWLHRVAGVLGLAEATSLANTGVQLEEHLLTHGRDAQLDDAIRRFGDDAAHLLCILRTMVDPLRL